MENKPYVKRLELRIKKETDYLALVKDSAKNSRSIHDEIIHRLFGKITYKKKEQQCQSFTSQQEKQESTPL